MARHGLVYRIFFPRNSYDASISIIPGWIWIFILDVVHVGLLWNQEKATASANLLQQVGAGIGIGAALFEILMYASILCCFRIFAVSPVSSSSGGCLFSRRPFAQCHAEPLVRS